MKQDYVYIDSGIINKHFVDVYLYTTSICYCIPLFLSGSCQYIVCILTQKLYHGNREYTLIQVHSMPFHDRGSTKNFV